MQANHPDIISEFISTLSKLAGKNDALLDLIGKVPLADYINVKNSQFEPREQIGGTCYANAVAAVLHLSMSRIVGRENGIPSFEDLR